MEQRADKDGLAHHEQAVTDWVGTISSSRYPRRTCLENFRHLLVTHLLLSGESWEKKQQAAGRSFRMGKADAEPPQYRACIAAKGCLEAEFLGMVSSKFFDGRHWKCPPAHKRTVDVQHLIFKVLSRMGCAAQEHLFLPHEQFPTKLLLILEDTDLGEAFVRTWETKKCMLDDFSAACIGKYKVAGFDDHRGQDRASTSGAIDENGHCGHRVAACFLATDA